MSEAKLLPCPFCGGEARATLSAYASGMRGHVMCESCGAKVLCMRKDLRDGIKKWNRRAERTCRMEPDGYYARCSECGCLIAPKALEMVQPVKFCPACGARVVGGGEA